MSKMKIHLIYPRGLRLVVFTITSNPREEQLLYSLLGVVIGKNRLKIGMNLYGALRV